MKKYYLHTGKGQEGPFDIQELKGKHLQKNTPIWFDGLSDWKPASEIEDLKELFVISTPPPYTVRPQTKSSGKSYLKAIKVIAGIILLIIVGSIVINVIKNNYNDMPASMQNSYEEQVLSVEEIEKRNPTNFLEVKTQYSENFWGNKFRIDGNIVNNATVANYKDVEIRITFLTATNTELSSTTHTFYEYFSAHSSKPFFLKVYRPKESERIQVSVINATPY